MSWDKITAFCFNTQIIVLLTAILILLLTLNLSNTREITYVEAISDSEAFAAFPDKDSSRKVNYDIPMLDLTQPTGQSRNRSPFKSHKHGPRSDSKFTIDSNNWEDIGKILGTDYDNKNKNVCHHFQAKKSTEKYPQVLQKTVFNPKHRFVFVMGIEGAGHHMFEGLLRRCGVCQCAPKLDKFSLSAHQSNDGLFGTRTPRESLNHYLRSFQKGIANFKAVLDKTKVRKTYFLNTLCYHWSTGEFSYPNYGEPCRRWKFPDVRILSELFESEGLDFRVLIVTRNAVDTLISTTVHRKFEPWETAASRYTHLLREDISKRQLERIDKKFVSCWNYDEFPYLPEETNEFLNINTKRFNLSQEMNRIFHLSSSTAKSNGFREKILALDVNKTHITLQKEIDNFRFKYC